MGKQSSRIYYRKKDHKDIYYNQHYHSAMYICEESEDGKVECKLVWRKIFDENLYIHATLGKNINSSIHIQPSVTVNMDTKKVYLATGYTYRDEEQSRIIYDPEWIGGKKYIYATTQSSFTNSRIYINKELVFNDVFKLYGTFKNNSTNWLHQGYQPATYVFSSGQKLLTIRKLLIKEGEGIEKDKLTIETISRSLQSYVNLNGYTVTVFNGYNSSNYIYLIARSSMSCILIRSDIDGNIESLKLENFDVTLVSGVKSPIIIGAKEEKVYLLATKVLEDDNSKTEFVINSITTIENMEISSTEVIDSWDDDSGNPRKGILMASVYMATVSPMTFVYSRDDVVTKYAHSSIITINENAINNADINIDTFSFFVNLYEDGEIVDTITVSSEYNCTDIKNGIVWFKELSEDANGFSGIVHYTADGWVEGGTHGLFYDEETQYFYTFYIEKLYPSSRNFFIRFRV